MHPVQRTLGFVLVLFICYYVVSLIWKERSHARRANKLGCKPAYIRPYRWPLGLDILKRSISMAQAQVLQNDDVELYKELGCLSTWYQNVLGYWHHFTVEPKNIQAMLASQFKDFELGPNRMGSLGPLVGSGIFTTDGKEWEHSRALLRPQFSRGQVADLKLEETHVQNLKKRLPAEADGWTAEIDLAPLFFNLTLDSATEFLLGESVNSQISTGPRYRDAAHNSEQDWSTFGPSFDRANVGTVIRSRLMDLHFLYSPPQFRKDCRMVHHFVDEYVDRALRATKSSGTATDMTEDSKTDSYVFLHELAKETRDRGVLRSQALNILLAGRDTTAGLLGWTFYLLARHPDKFVTLRAAVIEAFGTDVSRITFETLKGCLYLRYTINEVLRLHPLVPENMRRARRNTTLPLGGGPDGKSPIYIRAGQEVGYNVHIMHRREDLWGADANEFRPERWAHLKPGWEYLPFNGGPRICLGQQFALTEAGYVIVRMLQHFDGVENLDPDPIVRHKVTNTTSPAACLVRLHQAKE